MKKVVLCLGIVLLLVIAIFFISMPKNNVLEIPQQTVSTPSSAPKPTPIVITLPPLNNPTHLPYGDQKTRDQLFKKYFELSSQDHAYDWKVPFSFYGKVVDEENKPVAGASIALQWNTLPGLEAPRGSIEKSIQSDAEGIFQLTNQHGKCLGVRVEKEGYYTLPIGDTWFSYEFADPSNREYYQADPKNPVIFHLLSKSKGVTLVSKKVTLVFDQTHNQNGVDLMTGQIMPNGGLQIMANKPNLNVRQPVRFPWSMQITLNNGGFVETQEMLPFQAPDQGYSSTLNYNYTDPKAPNWMGGISKTYFFHLIGSNIYGVIAVNSNCDSYKVHLSYIYNPTPGDRNLEPNATSPQFNPNPY